MRYDALDWVRLSTPLSPIPCAARSQRTLGVYNGEDHARIPGAMTYREKGIAWPELAFPPHFPLLSSKPFLPHRFAVDSRGLLSHLDFIARLSLSLCLVLPRDEVCLLLPLTPLFPLFLLITREKRAILFLPRDPLPPRCPSIIRRPAKKASSF